MHKYTLSDVTAREKINLRARFLRIKVEEVAEHAGVSRSTLTRWKGQYGGVRLGKALKVAEKLTVAVEWLFDDRQGYPPPPEAERPQADMRFQGLEHEAAGLSRQQIVEAILEYRLKQARAGTLPSTAPGEAMDQSSYEQAKFPEAAGRGGAARGAAARRKAEPG